MPTFTAPIGGTNVIPEGEGPSRHPADAPSPLAQRKSLHTVRIAAPSAPEYKPEWKENGQLKWVQAEQAEEPAAAADEQIVDSPVPRGNADTAGQPYDALHREIAELKQTVQLMAQHQLAGGQPQQPQGPQPPNPEEYDFFEPSQVADFQRKNNEYIQWTVQQSVQAALAPHSNTLQDIELIKQHNWLVKSHGDAPNFKEAMDAAVKLVANSNFKFSLPEAFELMASVIPASPNQAAPSQSANQPRTITAQEAAQKAAQARSLPPRNGVSGAGEPALPASLMNVGALGRIMLHNQQTGRARPI